jgi:hypothetical protein
MHFFLAAASFAVTAASLGYRSGRYHECLVLMVATCNTGYVTVTVVVNADGATVSRERTLHQGATLLH